ncbi:MAG TPA: ABC transporter substrate-binding protein [Burkholderiales bacterium]
MNRRDALLALAALGAASAARAQSGRSRSLAVLMGYAEDDPVAQTRFAAFREGLAALGWVEGKNLKMEVRWSAGDPNQAAVFAKELVALAPDAILSNTTPVTAALQRETRSIPIVFTVVSDPVGSGFVQNLSRPGGNITGLINLEASLAEKWVQLLSQVAPKVKRMAVMFNTQTAPYAEYYLKRLNAAGDAVGVKTFIATVRREKDIDEVVTTLGRERGSGLIVMTDSYLLVNRKLIIAAAARRKVPTIYYTGDMVLEGGLISYGVDVVDLFRRAAPYVDRVLRGAKPADLPIEQPSKFEMFINAKTAKALGLAIPQSMLLRADKVIE